MTTLPAPPGEKNIAYDFHHHHHPWNISAEAKKQRMLRFETSFGTVVVRPSVCLSVRRRL